MGRLGRLLYPFGFCVNLKTEFQLLQQSCIMRSSQKSHFMITQFIKCFGFITVGTFFILYVVVLH